MKLRLISGIAFLFIGLISWSQNVEVALDTNEILIGDQIQMNLKFEGPAGDQVLWPVIQDTLTENLEVVSQGKIDTLLRGDIRSLQQALTLTSFDSGYHIVPALKFEYQKMGDTVINKLESRPMLLAVHTVEIDTTQVIRDIKPPVSAPIAFAEVLPWLIGFVGIALIVVLIIILVRRGKNKVVEKPKRFVPEVQPHVWALEELEKVRLEKLWQSGQVKVYYTRITDVTRKYIELRYKIEALEMTSDEVLDSLKDRVHPDCYSKLNESMFLSDMVKFAKAQPQPLEHDLCYNHLVDFVNETKLSAESIEQVAN